MKRSFYTSTAAGRKAAKSKNIIKAVGATLGALLVAGAFLITNSGHMAAAKGGTPGDTYTSYITYTHATCPLPESVKADYETIAYCRLVKRTGQTRDFTINVDGFTPLTPVVRDIRSTVSVTLPCGEVTTVDKFTENAFAQTSPVPPPYRLLTQSVKFADTCQL